MGADLDRRKFIRASATVGLAAAGVGALWPGAAEAATIAAQRSGAQRTVTPALFGLNGNNVQSGLAWDRDDLGAALAGLAPGLLRYPGGTIGNYWDWREGWFQPNGPWPAQPTLRFDNSLAPYQVALQRSGALPLFMLNMLTIDGRLGTAADNPAMIADQIEFLLAAASAGIGVHRVELGNEYYLSGYAPGDFGNDYSRRFPTAASYAEQANAWVAALRAEPGLSGLQIAAVGADATGSNSARREGWNSAVLSTLSGVDALTLHPFIKVAKASATPQSLLSLPHRRVQSLLGAEFPAIASHGMSAWITEFNMVDTTSTRKFAGTWTHGLFTAAYALLLAQVPTVTMIDLHNAVGDALTGALFDSTRGFRTRTPATQFLARTAKGAAYGAVLQAGLGATTGQPLSFPGGPSLSGGAPGLVGMEFGGGSRRQVIVVNLAPSTVTLGVSGLFSGAFSWTRISAASLTTRVTGPSSLVTASGTATSQLSIPPHCVVRLFQ